MRQVVPLPSQTSLREHFKGMLENEINDLVDKNKIDNKINEFFLSKWNKKIPLIISSISNDAAAVKLFHSMILTPDIKENGKNIQEIFKNFEALYEECIKNNEEIPIKEEYDSKSIQISLQ